MKQFYLVGALCSYLLAGCTGNTESQGHATEAPAEAHEHDHEHDHDHTHEAESGAHAPNEVHFTKVQAEAVGLQTERLEPQPFTQVIRTGGRILAAQGDEATLVATAAGVVTFGRLPVIDGSAVRKGQAVLAIASAQLPDGNYATKVKAAYETARKEYERMEQLVGDKIVSAKDFEQARLTYENAKAAYDALAGKETATGIAVTAPISGYLKDIRVKEGDYVAVGQPLATLSQNSRLTLRADVSEKYYSQLPLVRSAHFKTPYDKRVYRLDELHGRLLSYGKASDENSFYVPVTFAFDNKGAVIPGSFVEVYLLTAPIEGTLSLPLTALIEEQGIYSVFVRLDAEGFEKREVTLGANNGERVQILSGVQAGDEVVTRGAYQIKLSAASNAIPAHTHNH